MQIRRFSSDLKTRVPGNHQELYAVPIHFDSASISEERRVTLAQRFNGSPILLNRPLSVVAMYVAPHGAMEEHSNADVSTLFIVIRGRGFVRVGGPNGETREVTAGDVVLWPVGLDHSVWTEHEALEAIVVEGPPEREQAENY